MYDLLQSIFVSASSYTALPFHGACFPISCCCSCIGPFLTAISVLVVQLAVLNLDGSDSRAIVIRCLNKE